MQGEIRKIARVKRKNVWRRSMVCRRRCCRRRCRRWRCCQQTLHCPSSIERRRQLHVLHSKWPWQWQSKAATEEKQMLTNNQPANQLAAASSNIRNNQKTWSSTSKQKQSTSGRSGDTGSNSIYIWRWWASKIGRLMRSNACPSWWRQLNIIAAMAGRIFRVFL